jgi:DNA-binding LacI/PurR family transcriptional regulator
VAAVTRIVPIGRMNGGTVNDASLTSPAPRITLRDIAREAGVSHVTVSRALRNDPTISHGRRKEIKQLAAKMGYRPDPALAALAAYRFTNQSHRIQSALAWVNHWEQPEKLRGYREFDNYWHGALRAAERFGYHLDDLRWTRDISARRFEKILLTRNVRGVLIPPHRKPPDWGEFDWGKFSVVRFGLSVREPDTHLVTSDQLRATVMAIQRISSYGYRRIGMVVGAELDRNIGGNYTGGFFAAQKLFKQDSALSLLLVDSEATPHEVESPKTTTKLTNLLRTWLAKHKLDALLTADPRVPGLIRELGYRIPQDIAVAGTSISDIPVDAGINQNGEMIGRIAVQTLVSQINLNERGEPVAPCRILIESSWQDGKSLPRKPIAKQ